MKKFIHLCLPIAALALASCNVGDGEKLERTFSATQLNLISADDGSTASVIAPCYYYFRDIQNEGLMDITADDFEVGGKKITINSPSMKYSYSNTGFTFTSLSLGCQGASISAFHGKIATNVNVPPQSLGGPVTYGAVYQFIASYIVDNNFSVHTFPTDATYTGITSADDTSYSKPVYRVKINTNAKTADVYLYDFSVAPEMSTLYLKLASLPLKSQGSTYFIEGSDITPLDNANAPKTDCIFKSFKLTAVSADLTSVKIEFEISGQTDASISGQFQGSYIYHLS